MHFQHKANFIKRSFTDGASVRYDKRRSSGTSDREQAEKELGKFLIDRATEGKNDTPVETPDRYLIATALRWYGQEHGIEIASAYFTGTAIDNLVKFFGPHATVSNITPQVCRRYAKERTRKVRYYRNKEGNKTRYKSDKPVSNGTIRRELSVLVAALNHAVNNGRLTSAPKVEMPPEPPSKTRYLERDEIEKLLNNCIEPHLKLFVLLALHTGARKGALLEIKWQQIDFERRMLNLNPEGRLQTKKRRPIIPINDVLFAALMDRRQKMKEEQDEAMAAGRPIPVCPYVISYRNGPIENVRIGFNAACRRADITGVTPHTLRHTAGTLMALAGVELFLIAKLLGHSVQKTTELYAHHHPEYLRKAVNALNGVTPMMRLYSSDADEG